MRTLYSISSLIFITRPCTKPSAKFYHHSYSWVAWVSHLINHSNTLIWGTYTYEIWCYMNLAENNPKSFWSSRSSTTYPNFDKLPSNYRLTGSLDGGISSQECVAYSAQREPCNRCVLFSFIFGTKLPFKDCHLTRCCLGGIMRLSTKTGKTTA